MTNHTLNKAQQLDAADPLAHYRQQFVHADPELIYLNGNSLGRQPVAALAEVAEAQAQWGSQLVKGWSKWIDLPRQLGAKIAPLIGAQPESVLVSDTTSINIYKLAMAALKLRPGRKKIISNTLNFPSDLYVLQGCVKQTGLHELVLIDSADGMSADMDALMSAIDEDTALVSLSYVEFKSAYMYDMAAVTERAHAVGALVLWDLCHAVGAVPIELDADQVDFAVGCSYKYLNGGPGAPAFLYVNQALIEQAFSPITGWFGQHRPFDFAVEYKPAKGIDHFQISSPSILSMVGMGAGLNMLNEAGMAAVREKSLALTGLMIDLVDDRLATLGFTLASPRDEDSRGSHVSLRHPEAWRINLALINDMQVLTDFREPDYLRLGLAPLYNSFQDVWHAADRLATVITDGLYEKYSQDRARVT